MSKTFTERPRHALNGPTMGTRWSAVFYAGANFDVDHARRALQGASTKSMHRCRHGSPAAT